MREPRLYIIVRPIIKVLFKFLYRPVIVGVDNIPLDGRVILAGNHTNNLDCILLISSTKRVIHFLAKDELMVGMKRIIFKNMGIIPVNRRIHDKKALSSGIDVLNSDRVIGIFPEGTINKTNDIIMPFKIGAVKMANITDSKIVPFVIVGNYKIFGNNLRIEFLKPIYVDDNLGNGNERLMNIISDKLWKEK